MRSAAGVVAVVMTLLGSGLASAQEIDSGRGSTETSESATLAFTGDTLIHLSVARAAARHGAPYDFGPLFDPVRHILSQADIAICHLEVPLAPESTGITSFPIFKAPPQVADGLTYAGYDGCSTASNHSYDQGVEGVGNTLSILERAGLKHAGMAETRDDAWEATLYEAGDLTIGHISGTYSLNGFRLPEDKPWLVQLLKADEMIHAGARARAAGADLVVASIHCCVEYRRTPTPSQLEFTHELVESPFVDLVVTHHSHVVGPIEQVGGGFIAHGLGNFLSGQRQRPILQDGVIIIAHAIKMSGEWRLESLEVVPTFVERYSYRVVPAPPDSASFSRTMQTVNLMDAGIEVYQIPGLTPEELRLIE